MRWLILILAAFSPFVVHADNEAAKRRFLSVDEAEPWSGVGRLNARGGFCTAALISPDTLLTAAHCIYDRATGGQIPLSELRFVAGSREGYQTAYRRIISATPHPEWTGFHGQGVKVSSDIAIIRLESPITDVEGRTYVTGPAPVQGDDVVLLSYGRDREDALSIQSPCQVVQRFAKSASLNCDVTYGASGSPVFDDGRIVGVISAMSRVQGEKVAHAALLDGTLETLFQPNPAEAAAPEPAQRAVSGFKRPTASGGGLPGGKRPPSQ
ncbi:MAG: trypsin-like serine protease [Pseudomonadota bacterium]